MLYVRAPPGWNSRNLLLLHQLHLETQGNEDIPGTLGRNLHPTHALNVPVIQQNGCGAAHWHRPCLPQRGLPGRPILCEQIKETLKGHRNESRRKQLTAALRCLGCQPMSVSRPANQCRTKIPCFNNDVATRRYDLGRVSTHDTRQRQRSSTV